jgi:hypothetical protein
MYELKLGTDTDQIILLGETVAASWKGGVLKKSTAGSQTSFDIGLVMDVYHLVLEDTPANISTALTHLQALLNQAANYNRHHTGKPVNLYATQVQGDTQYTSILRNGFYDPITGSTARDQGSVGISLTFDRFDFWEGPSTIVPLSNRSANRATSGVAVVNHLDSGAYHDNFVDILGSDIGGDLPAAANMDYSNASAVAYSLDSLIMHLNAYSAPTTFTPVYEGTGTADASCSGGSKASAFVNTSDISIFSFNILPAQALAAGGNDFMVLLRLAAPIPSADVIMHVYLANIGWMIFDLPPVLVPAGQGIIELGVLTLPPGINPLLEAGPATIGLTLSAKTTTGSRTIYIDYVYLAAMDGYRRFNRIGRTLYQDECIVDDGYGATCYLETNATALIAPNYNTFGAQFKLIPGIAQRIGFFQVGAHAGEIDRPGWVHIHYKPRKRYL